MIMKLSSPMAFLSYHPLKSIHCLTSSIGGWAPYTSNAGMLRSSMKKMKYLPSGGPKTPLRLDVKVHNEVEKGHEKVSMEEVSPDEKWLVAARNGCNSL